MKTCYLYLRMSVTDGERGYICHDIAWVDLREPFTNEDMQSAAEDCAKNFYPCDDAVINSEGDAFDFFNGECTVSIDKWREISEAEFKFLNLLFYGSI